jgi:ATP-dependent helicase YprA (DUF1998 family)
MTTPGSVMALLDRLRTLPYYADQIIHVEKSPGKPASYATLAVPLHPVLARAFQRCVQCSSHADSQETEGEGEGEEGGSECLRLYSHQVLAVDALRAGRHVTISTPTASGEPIEQQAPCCCCA